MTRDEALFQFDERASGGFRTRTAGIDEAGRGPLAGPVVACAVIFHRRVSLKGLNDSKKISPRLRERLFMQIIPHAWAGIGCVPEPVIDRINILQATRLAMREAVLALPRTPDLLLVDGPISLDLPLPQKGILQGDGRSAAIAASSIIAKVFRDSWMRRLDRLYPRYGFAAHKGYPTAAHLEALREKGASPVHRKTFGPVARICQRAEG